MCAMDVRLPSSFTCCLNDNVTVVCRLLWTLSIDLYINLIDMFLFLETCLDSVSSPPYATMLVMHSLLNNLSMWDTCAHEDL
jgi:hypothetical protein